MFLKKTFRILFSIFVSPVGRVSLRLGSKDAPVSRGGCWRLLFFVQVFDCSFAQFANVIVMLLRKLAAWAGVFVFVSLNFCRWIHFFASGLKVVVSLTPESISTIRRASIHIVPYFPKSFLRFPDRARKSPENVGFPGGKFFSG
jgi:hypothetical protein